MSSLDTQNGPNQEVPSVESKVHRVWLVVIIGLLLVIGIGIRIIDLDRTMTHPELYVPGIPLPSEHSEPQPRLSLIKTITASVGGEHHPPGYYVLMFFISKCFGSNVLWIRLPSVLFGGASIVLIYWLCTLEGSKLTGLLSAGMLTLNGLHIFWSQEARMFTLACFLGLLSTIFLVLVFKRTNRQGLYQVLYVVATLAGLGMTIYFWPILLTQMLWCVWVSLKKTEALPGIFRSQFFVAILACPLIAQIAYHSGRESYVDGDLLTPLINYL